MHYVFYMDLTAAAGLQAYCISNEKMYRNTKRIISSKMCYYFILLENQKLRLWSKEKIGNKLDLKSKRVDSSYSVQFTVRKSDGNLEKRSNFHLSSAL